MNSKFLKSFNFLLIFGVIILGFSSGLISYLLHEATHLMTHLLRTGEVFSFPTFVYAFLITSTSLFLTKNLFIGTEGSGIPQVKLSLVALKGKMPKRMPFGKFLTSALSLSSGLSVGKEGPMVTISASLGHLYAHLLKLPQQSLKLMVIAGASSGLSAAFNTPIAAITFTIEEILGEFKTKYLGPIIIASVLASVTTFRLLGVKPIFPHLDYELIHEWHLVFHFLLGIIISVLGFSWIKTILFFKNLRQLFPSYFNYIFCLLVVLAVGLASWYRPEILGDGSGTITEILKSPASIPLGLLLSLFSFKFILSAASYSTGISGGVFLPVLFLGALAGASLASILSILGVEHIQIGAFALLGMTSFLVSTIKTPFTAFIMLFEMTGDYKMILPLMISSASAYFVGQMLSEESIYESLAEYEGVHLPSPKDDEILGEMFVENCMVTNVKCLQAYDLIEEVKNQISEDSFGGYPVLKNGEFFGVISKKEVFKIEEISSENRLIQYTRRDIIAIYPDQSLLVAIEKLNRFKIGRLPVISRFNKKRIIGIITMEDIVKYFEQSKDNSEEENRGEA